MQSSSDFRTLKMVSPVRCDPIDMRGCQLYCGFDVPLSCYLCDTGHKLVSKIMVKCMLQQSPLSLATDM